MQLDIMTPEHLRDAVRSLDGICTARGKRIAELEARLSALIAGSILPADGADEIVVDGVRWVRVPAECSVRFERSQ